MRRLILSLLLALAVPALAAANGYEIYPAPLVWLPDSALLAACVPDSWPPGEVSSFSKLRLLDRDGARLDELRADSVHSPSFGDEGGLWVALDERVVRLELADGLAASARNTPQPVLDVVQGYPLGDTPAPVFFSAGQRFYGAQLWRMSPDGGRLDTVVSLGATSSATCPVPLPDGNRLLYLRQPDWTGDHAYERIWLRDLTTGGTRKATQPQPAEQWPDDYHESNIVVLNDREILFQRGGWGDWSILRLHIDSGAETVEATDAQQPSVSADGRWLAFTRRPAAHKSLVEYDWDVIPQVWVLDRNSGRQWLVEHSIGGAQLPAVSPDGTRLAWLEYNLGAVQVVVRDLAELTAAEPTIDGSADAQSDVSSEVERNEIQEAENGSHTNGEDMTPFNVVLETTAGDIVLEVHPDWSPKGAAHFRELVEAGFYDGAPWFRVIPGFVAQAGIAADAALHAQWTDRNIQDEPVRQGNTRGFVSYGMSGQPNSRSTHFFINYGDNSRLDDSGFGAFAEVVEGMDIAAGLHAIPDDAFARRGLDQGSLQQPGGVDKFRTAFPDADWIKRAYVRE